MGVIRMLAKLAARNVKRQIGNYLIYFITVSLTVALMFAMNNVIFSRQMLEKAQGAAELKSGLIVLTVFVSVIVAFVLGYATSFLLKLRRREFGTYLTLGMTRKNILGIFMVETMIMGIAALAAGILFGLFLYQGMMQLLVRLMEVDLAFASYSWNGLILTVVLVAAIFLLASLTSAFYLKKVSIYQLIHSEKVVEKGDKHPIIWAFVTVLSAAAVIWSFLAFQNAMEETFKDSMPMGAVLKSILVLACALISFHIGMARSLAALLLKNKKLGCRGTNTFTLRQLCGRLRTNSVMVGVLAFLIAFAVIGANTSFVQKEVEQAALERQYPFDITATLYTQDDQGLDVNEAEKIIDDYAQVTEKHHYSIYTSEESYLYGFTKWSGEDYRGLTDYFMRESDYRKLYSMMGKEAVTLKGGFLILANIAQVLQYDFNGAKLELNGNTYGYTGVSELSPMLEYTYFTAVVPDEAVEGMSVAAECYAYDLADKKFDAAGLRKALTYSYHSEYRDEVYDRCDYRIRENGRIQKNEASAVFILGALYLAVTFVFMAMAILALKTLSGLSEDRIRYGILFRLGAGKREQEKTLFRQIFGFFALPFVLPLLLSIPVGMICSEMMKLGGFPKLAGDMAGIAGAVAAGMLLIYLLYFTATYLVAKKSIIQEFSDGCGRE